MLLVSAVWFLAVDGFVVPQTSVPRMTLRAVKETEGNVAEGNVAQLLQTAAKLRHEAKELEAELKKGDVDELFSIADVNRDGHVTPLNLKTTLKQEMATLVEKKHAEELVDDDACFDHVFQDLDMNHDGTLERDEFVSLTEFKDRFEQLWTIDHPATTTKTPPEEVHPAVAMHKKTEKRLEIFESRASEDGPVFRMLSALTYVLPIVEAGHLGIAPIPGIAEPLNALSWQYLNTPFAGLIAFIILFNVCIEYRVPRLLRFSARHSIVLDLIAVFVLAPLTVIIHNAGSPMLDAVLPTGFEALCIFCAGQALLGQTSKSVPLTGWATDKMTADCDQEIIDVIKDVTNLDSDYDVKDDDDASDSK